MVFESKFSQIIEFLKNIEDSDILIVIENIQIRKKAVKKITTQEQVGNPDLLVNMRIKIYAK